MKREFHSHATCHCGFAFFSAFRGEITNLTRPRDKTTFQAYSLLYAKLIDVDISYSLPVSDPGHRVQKSPKQITFKIHEKPLSVFHGVVHFNWNENKRPLVVLLALDFRWVRRRFYSVGVILTECNTVSRNATLVSYHYSCMWKKMCCVMSDYEMPKC